MKKDDHNIEYSFSLIYENLNELIRRLLEIKEKYGELEQIGDYRKCLIGAPKADYYSVLADLLLGEVPFRNDSAKDNFEDWIKEICDLDQDGTKNFIEQLMAYRMTQDIEDEFKNFVKSMICGEQIAYEQSKEEDDEEDTSEEMSITAAYQDDETEASEGMPTTANGYSDTSYNDMNNCSDEQTQKEDGQQL